MNYANMIEEKNLKVSLHQPFPKYVSLMHMRRIEILHNSHARQHSNRHLHHLPQLLRPRAREESPAETKQSRRRAERGDPPAAGGDQEEFFTDQG